MLVLGAVSYAVFLQLSPPQLPESVIYGNGRIEATEVAVSAEVTGRVVESRLVEGQTVEAGEALVRLDDTDLRTRVKQAEARALTTELTQARLDRQLSMWRHHLETAEAHLARYRELRATSNISQEAVDSAEDRYREAQGQIEVLEAQQAETKADHEAARHQVDLLRSQLDKTTVRAPITGTVLVRGIEDGEFASAGRTVARLADLTALELNVFIPVPDLAKVSLGDPARVRVDAFPDRNFEARVARIDPRAVFTPRDIYMPDERVRIVHRVTLAVQGGDGALHPGMPADAWVLWQPEADWPATLPIPR